MSHFCSGLASQFTNHSTILLKVKYMGYSKRFLTLDDFEENGNDDSPLPERPEQEEEDTKKESKEEKKEDSNEGKK